MKLYNYPVKSSFSDYDDAIQQYLNIIKDHNELVSVYQIGSVAVPGISDIDLIIILDDNKVCKNNFSIYQIDSKYHKLLLHDVFIIPESLSKETFFTTSIFDRKLLFGEIINFNFPILQSDRINDLLLKLNDLVIFSLKSEYSEFKKHRGLDIRFVIARINSIKYPYILLQELYSLILERKLEVKSIENIIRDISSFRESFFKLSKDQVHEKIIFYLDYITSEFVPMFIQIFEDIHPFKETYPSKVKFRLSFLNYIFIDEYYAFHLIRFSENKGKISSHIKRNLVKNNNIIYSDDLRVFIDRKISILNSILEFRISNNISYGSIWTYNSEKKTSFKDAIIIIIKKII